MASILPLRSYLLTEPSAWWSSYFFFFPKPQAPPYISSTWSKATRHASGRETPSSLLSDASGRT